MLPATDRFRPFVQAIWETGCRPGELRGLQWCMVSRDRRTASMAAHKTAKKTGKHRTLYFRTRDDCVAPIAAWRGWIRVPEQAWQTIHQGCHPAAISQPEGIIGAEGCGRLFLRHAFPARAITQGVDVATVAELMGHASLEMIAKTYGHLEGKKSPR